MDEIDHLIQRASESRDYALSRLASIRAREGEIARAELLESAIQRATGRARFVLIDVSLSARDQRRIKSLIHYCADQDSGFAYARTLIAHGLDLALILECALARHRLNPKTRRNLESLRILT